MKYVAPDINLLNEQPENSEITTERILEIKNHIQETFDSFNIRCKVTDYNVSPLNIIFDLDSELGVKSKEIHDHQTDIDVAAGTNTKIFKSNEKSKLCIAVPLSTKSIVNLRTVLQSSMTNPNPMSIASGIDENGHPFNMELDKAPHVLIAGSSGTGKTVYLDDIIINLLYKNSPSDVRLLLIDPSLSDFKVYSDIPHLICPVLNNKAEITDALSLVCNEIDKRYNLFAAADEKDFVSYNLSHSNAIPRIVIIIDKFMELTYEMPGEFKSNLERISAKGRAAGIHLIINSQSPTNDIIPGLIKANLTYRISFSLASSAESRSILDKTGAEKLLGNGEMIFFDGTTKNTAHVQAALISYNEVERIISYIKMRNDKPIYYPEFASVHRDYKFSLSTEYLIPILDSILEYSKITVKDIPKKLNISLAEAYHIMNVLIFLKFIDPISNGYHIVNYDRIMYYLKKHPH